MCVKDIIENVVQRSKKLSYDEHPIQCILRNIGLMDQYITAKQCYEMAHISYFVLVIPWLASRETMGKYK